MSLKEVKGHPMTASRRYISALSNSTKKGKPGERGSILLVPLVVPGLEPNWRKVLAVACEQSYKAVAFIEQHGQQTDDGQQHLNALHFHICDSTLCHTGTC
jgi:hypothetical protein